MQLNRLTKITSSQSIGGNVGVKLFGDLFSLILGHVSEDMINMFI